MCTARPEFTYVGYFAFMIHVGYYASILKLLHLTIVTTACALQFVRAFVPWFHLQFSGIIVVAERAWLSSQVWYSCQ